MMAGSPNLEDRFAMLEADVGRQAALVDLAPERPASLGGPRNPRWAVTCKKDTGSSYPAEEDQPNTYWIKFLDSTYSETEGDQTPSDTERQTEGATLAHYRDREPYQYIPEGTVVLVLFDHGRWWILGPAPSGKAECITFTTTEDMGYSESGSALAQIDDWYRGYDPAEEGFRVYDPQGLFPRALSGAKGKATYDDRSDEYHITECQQMATVCACVTYAAVASTDPTWVPSSVEVMFPIVGQLPTIASVRNTFSDEMSAATLVIIGWNETDDVWDVLEVKRKPSSIWVKTQSAWETAGGGDPHDKVLVKRCDADGSNETGSPGYIYLPDAAGRKPNVGAGEVLAAELMEDGLYICTSDYLDEAFGTILWWSGAVVDIREGWELCDGTNGTVDLSGRFLMCIDEGGASDEDEIGDTGGHRWHGKTENNHADHPDHCHHASDDGLFINAIGGATPGAPSTTDAPSGDSCAVTFFPAGIFNAPNNYSQGASQQEGVTDEVQTLTFNGGATDGTFTLTLDNDWGTPVTTAPIAWNATSAQVEAAIDAATGEAAFVTMGGPQIAWGGEQQTVTFNYLGAGAPPHTLITYNLGGLTGGTPTLTVERTTTVPVDDLVGHAGDPDKENYNDGDDTDNRPRYYVLAAIQRIDNSV